MEHLGRAQGAAGIADQRVRHGAEPALLAGVIARLGNKATLVSIPDADHGLDVGSSAER